MTAVANSQAQEIIETLASRNSAFYSDARGHGALKDLQQSFPHAWIYVAELIQNAVDAEAKTIRFSKTKQGALILEHDGKEFDEADVVGICTKGVSSKGAGTVGFMGVGFKSVFRSFQTVTISSGPWKFRLQAKVTKGEVYGDQQRDWLGTVLPMWADDATPPSEGMSCRFEMRDRLKALEPVQADFDAVFRADEALLAQLAMRNIRLVQLFENEWALAAQEQPSHPKFGVKRHVISALAGETNLERKWMLFRGQYKPSDDAVARFLEHRQLTPKKSEREKVYGEAARSRTVDLFFPLDAEGFPNLPEHGEAFALLPTALEIPFGVHINADWLLTVTRGELMDIGAAANVWQDEIRAQIPKLIAAYLEWLGSEEGPNSGEWKTAYRVFPDSETHESLAAWIAGDEVVKILKELLADVEFLPGIGQEEDGTFSMLSPLSGRVLPSTLAKAFQGKSELKPRKLFGDSVVDSSVLGPRASAFLRRAEMLKEITASELGALWKATGVKEWVGLFSEDARDDSLCTLLQALAETDAPWAADKLTCLPTEADTYTSIKQALRLPPDWNIVVNEPEILAIIDPFLGDKKRIVKWSFDACLLRNYTCWSILKTRQLAMDDVLKAWWDDMPATGLTEKQIADVLTFTCWVQEKQTARRPFVKKLLAQGADGKIQLLPCSQTLLADPYAGVYRRRLFPDMPAVAEHYIQQQSGDQDWRAFLEDCAQEYRPAGKAPLLFSNTKVGREKACELLGTEAPSLRATWYSTPWPKCRVISVDSSCYMHIDVVFPPVLRERLESVSKPEDVLFVPSWLADNMTSIREYRSQRLLYLPYGLSFVSELSLDLPARWVTDLNSFAWVLARDGSGPYRPADVLEAPDEARPEARIAQMDENVALVLKEVGIEFGVNVPQAQSIRKLQVRGSDLTLQELDILLAECLDDASRDPVAKTQLQNLLMSIPVLPVPAGVILMDGAQRVTGARCVRLAGAGRRSNLEWVVAVSTAAPESAELQIYEKALEIIDAPDQTTAGQCMDFLEWVWSTRPDADRVRQLLPRAYDYVSQDLESQPEWQLKWESLRTRAVVYTLGRKWAPIQGEEHVYYNDLGVGIGAVIPKSQIATPGHLGDNQQGVDLLHLPRLSRKFRLPLKFGTALACPQEWENHIGALGRTLHELANAAPSDAASAKMFRPIALKRVSSIYRNVVDVWSGEQVTTIELWALRQQDGCVVVGGDPEDFAADLCRILLDEHTLPDDDAEDVSRQVVALLTILGQSRFELKLRRLRHKFGLADQEVIPSGEPSTSGREPNLEEKDSRESAEPGSSDVGISNNEEEEEDDDDGGDGMPDGDETGAIRKVSKGLNKGGSGGSSHPSGDRSGFDGKPRAKHPGGGGGGNGSHTPEDREGLLAHYLKQAALLTGVSVNPASKKEVAEEDEENGPPDELYRSAVLAYERQQGRFAVLKAPDQVGHDIDSFTSPEGGANRALIRRIEVKGRSHAWTDAQTVELSRPQFKAADARAVEEDLTCEEDFDYWLYVVEDMGDQRYQVLPIRNPATHSAKFEVRGGTWRAFAEEPAEVSISEKAGFVASVAPRPAAPGRRSILDLKERKQNVADTNEELNDNAV